jgi:DNA-binding SARP family transcriptional activator
VPDESLTALSIAGLSAAMVGLGDLREADFFSTRANLVATAFGNPFELGTCRLQRAQVDSASGNHAAAVAAAREAIDLFESINGEGPLRAAYYRLALCHFRANHRGEAQKALANLETLLTQPWMVGMLLPLVRENPMFAQWVASRNLAGPYFRKVIERSAFTAFQSAGGAEEQAPTRLPRVVARSLGMVHVTVGGREVTDDAWSSGRAKELFFLFLANRSGLRKEEAVEALYPELPQEKCNSAFHSNLYRVRKALYADSVVKRDGAYVLNPEGEFEWDVELFEDALKRAQKLPSGSDERAQQYRNAIDLYRGPFAEAFCSEWAESIRMRSEERATEALALLAGYYAGREDYETAATCMEQVIRHDQYNDEAVYTLATYRVRAGQPVIALAVIDDYRQLYERDLGGRVPERFLRLRSQIATGAAG